MAKNKLALPKLSKPVKSNIVISVSQILRNYKFTSLDGAEKTVYSIEAGSARIIEEILGKAKNLSSYERGILRGLLY